MKYEVSNIIFKDKPTDKKMAKKYPFRHIKEQVHLFEDTPYNLYLTYKRGFSMKPHPFTENTLNEAKVHAIVLDFDHLTIQQKDFIESIVNGKFQFKDIYGDYSSGTKARLYENRDIPNYENPKWGYKVFYPADCLCTWKELNDTFIEAVSFFNPLFSMEKVREVWAKWLKANNRKDKVNDPIFKDWILPDVAMLNSYRTQITYGVKPDLKKDYVVKAFPNNDIYSIAAFPSGDLSDYRGLEWRPEEIIIDKDSSDEVMEAWQKLIEPVMIAEIEQAKQNPNDLKLNLPTSRSVLARRLKKQTFEDLAWDDKANSILNARLYAREIDYDKAKQVMIDSARTLTRNLIEMEFQRNICQNTADALKNNLHALLHDTLIVARQRCGLKLLEKRGIDEELRKKTCQTIIRATNNFMRFRTRLKLKQLETEINPPHLQLLNEYCDTGDKSKLAEYNRQRRIWLENNEKEANKLKLPYTYKKKGLKKWLICVATLDLSKEELEDFGLEPVRLKDEKVWVDWCLNTLGTRHDDLNDVSRDDLKKWYRDYKREYNSKWGMLEGKLDRRTGKKTSKYDEQFKDMSDEDVLEWIETHDLHRQQKKRIKEWLTRRTFG